MQVPHAGLSSTSAALAVMERCCLQVPYTGVMRHCGSPNGEVHACAQVPYAGLNGIRAALAVMERGLHTP